MEYSFNSGRAIPISRRHLSIKHTRTLSPSAESFVVALLLLSSPRPRVELLPHRNYITLPWSGTPAETNGKESLWCALIRWLRIKNFKTERLWTESNQTNESCTITILDTYKIRSSSIEEHCICFSFSHLHRSSVDGTATYWEIVNWIQPNKWIVYHHNSRHLQDPIFFHRRTLHLFQLFTLTPIFRWWYSHILRDCELNPTKQMNRVPSQFSTLTRSDLLP